MTTKQEEWTDLLKGGIDDYEATFIEAIGECVEDGQVIGVPEVSKAKLRAFFDSISPQEWLAATIEDPEGALGMLAEYQSAQAGG